MHDVWRALWTSRLLVWIAGAGTVSTLGFGPVRHAFNPPGVLRGFGALGDVLAAPAARWDAAWYLVIAHYGYRPDFGTLTASRTAFFPLYPLGLRALSGLGLAPVIAGVLLSVFALGAGLYGLHRLTTLEAARLRLPDGARVARLVVLLSAFAPMAFYFSAIYSESLYLALSVGLFLCARRGRWASAAMLGGLAAATRSSGVVLVAPLLLFYLYGPREDRRPDRTFEDDHPPDRISDDDGRSDRMSEDDCRPDRMSDGDYLSHRRLRDHHSFEGGWAAGGRMTLATALRELPRTVATLGRALRPRYRVRRDAAWLALVPVGLGFYMAYLALSGGDALAPFHAQAVWNRHFAGPYGGVWDGAKAAFEGLRQLLSFQRHHIYYRVAGGSPFIDAGHNLLLFAFLLAAIPAAIGVLRMLPLAYGVYTLAALALPLSYPVAPQPLMSLPRFLVVLFPLTIWLAVRLALRERALRWAVLVVSGLAMAFFTAQFATWHWVA
jgi:Mannosyltransferase (PIG-V)